MELDLSPDEQAICALTDDQVGGLLELARQENKEAKEQLLLWSYLTAYNFSPAKNGF